MHQDINAHGKKTRVYASLIDMLIKLDVASGDAAWAVINSLYIDVYG